MCNIHTGVGKTTVLREISRMCKEAKIPLISSAATGVAAGAMMDGGTNHSRYGLPVFQNNEYQANEFLPPLSQTVINRLMEQYEESLTSGTSLSISIDEFSMVDACR
jgi:hypothetical protein